MIYDSILSWVCVFAAIAMLQQTDMYLPIWKLQLHAVVQVLVSQCGHEERKLSVDKGNNADGLCSETD